MNRGELILASPQSRVNIKQLSKILRRRSRIILSVFFVVISVASILAIKAKPIYQSNMQILVAGEGVSSNQHTGANSEAADLNVDTEYTAQMKLMLSSMLIQKAVNLLRVEYPDITVEHIKGNSTSVPLTLTTVRGQTKANIQSPVFEISFQDDDPVKVQKVLQALQKVYQKYNIDQQKERLNKGLSFISDRLPKVKQQMNQAQKKLEQFRKKNNLLDPEVQGRILLQSLADIRKQLQITRAQLQDLQARSNNLQQELASSNQNTFLNSSLNQPDRHQALLNEIQKTEQALTQEQQRYTDDSPIIQKLQQQRQSQIVLLQKEVETQGDKATLKVDMLASDSIQGQVAAIDQKLTEDLIKLQTAVQGLRANEKSLGDTEQQIRSELSKYPSLIAQYNHLLPEVEINRKTLEQLVQAQQSLGLKIAQAGFNWQMLEEPQRGTYLGSNRSLFLLEGLLIGPVLGILAALLWEMSHDAINSPQDLHKLTNRPLLGTVPIPRLRPRKRLFSQLATGRQTDNSLDIYTFLPVHETLDMVYQNIQILTSLPLKSLMLTSSLSKEGTSTLALGLADSSARMHRRVLVIDANLRQPCLHKILGLSNDWGLSLLLVEDTNSSVREYIQPVHPSVDVLTAGPTPEDVVKLLSSQRMKELLEFFEQTYDLVLIDAPPILGTVDSRILASLCDGIVMVGRIGKVSANQLIQATDILSKLNLIGIIANVASSRLER